MMTERSSGNGQMMTKHSVLMVKIGQGAKVVVFGEVDGRVDFRSNPEEVFVSLENYHDMGEPSMVTVTIEAGDTLNEDT